MKITPKLVGLTLAFAIVLGMVALMFLFGKTESRGRLAANCTDLADFIDPCGLQFKYPRSWQVQRHVDSDTLVKISGWTQSGTEAELVVSVADNPVGLSSEKFSQLLDKLLFSKLTDVKKVLKGDVLLGKSGLLKGYLQQVGFSLDGYIASQEILILPAKGKIFTFTMGTQEWEHDQAQPVWEQCLNSIDGPKNLFDFVLQKDALAVQQKTSKSCAVSDRACTLAPARPPANWSLSDKIKVVLPLKDEERFLEIPWESNLELARSRSEDLGKPLFIWIMDGNVLGAT